MAGSAIGGLSDQPPERYKTCSLALGLATKLGPYGYPPEVTSSSRDPPHQCGGSTLRVSIALHEVQAPPQAVAARNLEPSLEVGPYSRKFGCSLADAADLETTLQLVRSLFTHSINPNDERLLPCLQCAPLLLWYKSSLLPPWWHDTAATAGP